MNAREANLYLNLIPNSNPENFECMAEKLMNLSNMRMNACIQDIGCKGIFGLPNITGRKNSEEQFHYSVVAEIWRAQYFKSSLPKIET